MHEPCDPRDDTGPVIDDSLRTISDSHRKIVAGKQAKTRERRATRRSR